ncbi:hypothetical protein [Arthrobacter sp. A5]
MREPQQILDDAWPDIAGYRTGDRTVDVEQQGQGDSSGNHEFIVAVHPPA